MKIFRSAGIRQSPFRAKGLFSALRYRVTPNISRPFFGLNLRGLDKTIGLIAAIVVALGIVLVNYSGQSDLVPTLLYLSVLLMAANLFSINLVIIAAALSIALLTLMFLIDSGYHSWDAANGYFRCLVGLAAMSILAVRCKYAGDSLRHNQAYLTGAQRLSQTGSVGFCGDGEAMSWSEEAARIFEYPHAVPPTAAMVLARTHPDDVAMFHEAFAQAARNEQLIEVKHRLLMPDGRIKHIHMIASPVFPDPARREYFGAVMDVTASREAEEALVKTQAQLAHVTRVTSLGELAASIAHEVNQPLTAIISSGEACRQWINRPEPNLHEARDALNRIIRAAGRANDVISGVRALSRKCGPVRQTESLDDIVSETLRLVRHDIAHHNITPQIELTTFGTQVDVDRVQLQQVIINLLINACQAMVSANAPDRTLQVRTWVQDNQAHLEVLDQGGGIADELMDSLFNPFFTTKDSGLGMGLSICRSIIEFHGGRIWAISHAPVGAAFCFALPLLGDGPDG